MNSMTLISESTYGYLVADVVNGVYYEPQWNHNFHKFTPIEQEEDFYNQLAELEYEEIIYCLFKMHSEVYNKIDKEYGIY